MPAQTLDELVDEIKKEFESMPSSFTNHNQYSAIAKTPLAVHRSIQHDQIKKLIKEYIWLHTELTVNSNGDEIGRYLDKARYNHF